MTYKPVGINESSDFPPRVEARLATKFDALNAGVDAVEDHVAADDPHGDRAYTDAQISGLGGGSGGPITSDEITDATATGISVLTAANATAARSAIGAGTSNLALGSSSTTALAGNTAIPGAASTTPAALGTAAVGTGTTFARADHVHTMPTSSDVGAVPTTRTVAGHALSANVTITAADVSAVPTTRTVAGKALSADVTLTASDVSAVPTTRQVAGHALSADVTLVKADVGLGNVDNTSDVNKPVSTATATALADKLDSDNLLDQSLTVLPKTTLTVVYSSGWTLPSGLSTRADVAWLFQGGDAAHPPPSTTGAATWVRSVS